MSRFFGAFVGAGMALIFMIPACAPVMPLDPEMSRPAAPEIAAAAKNLPIIVYHQLCAGGDVCNGPMEIETEKFDQEMQYLADHGYKVLDMDDVMSFLNGYAFPQPVIAIQFDDGWRSQLKAIPVLDKLGFPASFFLIVGGVGTNSYMTWDEATALSRNPRFSFYSHTMTHPWRNHDNMVTWLSEKADTGERGAEWELRESKTVLQNKMGRTVPFLAWPANDYNEELVRLAVGAGYTGLLDTGSGFNHPGGDPLHIRRIAIDGRCDLAQFELILKTGQGRECR